MPENLADVDGTGDVVSQLAVYDRLVKETLQPDLQAAMDARDVLLEEVSEYSKLRDQIKFIQSSSLTTLKTMVDLGSDFYAQAKVPDTSMITIDLRVQDYHANMTLDEALGYIDRKEAMLKKRIDRLTEKGAKLRSDVRVCLEAMAEIYKLDKADREGRYEEDKY
ncbi:hypothetical protein YB2330_004559 [Saitoella coloradoensis]